MLTQAQFNQWFLDFQQRYPAVKEYVQKQERPSVLADTWYQSMSAFDLETLKEVTRMMMRGDIDEIPNTELGHFGSEIRKRARQVNDLRRAGEPQDWERTAEREHERRYRCGLCLDTGYVSIYGPKVLKSAWNYDPAIDEPKFVMQPTAMACMCSKGSTIAEGWKRKGSPIGQWYKGCETEHALIRVDGPDGVVHHSCLACERGDYEDILQAQRTILHERLVEFDRMKHTHRDFVDYGPQRSEF